MKKLIVVIRVGTPAPLPKEFPLLDKLLDGDLSVGVGMPFAGCGFLSILHTRFTPKEIEQEFKALAEETEDVLPIIAFELGDENVVFDAPIPGLDSAIAELKRRVANQRQVIQMNLDDLLDLANRKGGIDQLSTEEKELLDKLSKNSD